MTQAARDIEIRYRACDGFNMSRRFKTLAGARRFAHKYVGPAPEIAFGCYAISGDGVGRVTVRGCDLTELFPATEQR